MRRNILTGMARAYPPDEPGEGACPHVQEFSFLGGPPTSGSVIWTYDIDGNEEDVEIEWNDSAAGVKSSFETAFSGISLAVTVTGGPLPNLAVYVQFAIANDVTWPPVQSTTDLDAGAPLLRRNSPM